MWDGHLARHGAALLAGRLELVDGLAAPAVEAFAEVAPSSPPMSLAYRSSLDGAPPDDAEKLEPLLLDALLRVRRQEVERGVCLVGPHRDDLELSLGEGPAKGYASHGESWSLALAPVSAVIVRVADQGLRASSGCPRRGSSASSSRCSSTYRRHARSARRSRPPACPPCASR